MKSLLKLVLLSAVMVLSACATRELNTKVSHATGWTYADRRTTNFDAKEGITAGVPVGMVSIEGGSFTIGERDEFLTAPRNNATRTLTVSSFYMDKYEVTNLDWNEYLTWLNVVFGATAPELVQKAKPDSTVWREELAYNEPYLAFYFTHPAYSFYPVVGVSWTQAMAYCQWRTDRVNERILWSAGAIAMPPFDALQPTDDEGAKEDFEQTYPGYEMDAYETEDPTDPENTITMYRPSYEWIRDKFVFNTEKYLYVDDYNPEFGRHPFTDTYGEDRKANKADGLLVVGYRLPTEAEWEFAAYAPVASEDGLTIEGKLYPWSGYHPRDLSKQNIGKMQANFVRGRGDMMGTSGALNDRYVITAPVDAYMPNDFGLYNMAGNVNEWVMDVYRETSSEDISEYNSYRGNIYTQPKRNDDGTLDIDSTGCVAVIFQEGDDKRDYKDGDLASRIVDTDYPLDTTGVEGNVLVDPTDILVPRMNKEARVYKGGSWRDRIYWLNPSSRRYMNQDASSNTIGFRCAMSKLGDKD
jgi:gliding motility-associated lipoprotein GldJ